MMKKVLFVNGCVRPGSRTLRLAQAVLERIGGTVEEVNLEQEHIQPLNNALMEQRDTLVDAKGFSAPMLQYAMQFVQADEIVIAAPYWDLAFPASLRIYIEAVTVTGVAFHYTPEGCAEGLCKAKKITYVTTAGGAVGEYNMGYDYIKALAHEFYGIPEVLCFMAENLDIRGVGVEGILQKSLAEIAESPLLSAE